MLSAAEEHAGEAVLDDIAAWAVDWTRQEGKLPSPARLREEMHSILEARGVEIPDDSPLAL